MFLKLFAAFAAVLVCAGLFLGFGKTTAPSLQSEQDSAVLTDAVQDVREHQPQTAVTVHLTHSEAEQAALAHAGLQAQEVVFSRTEYDIDDGVPEWEIEFRCGDYEYGYTVHAEDGRILNYERDYEPVRQAEPTPQNKPAEPEPQQTAPEVTPAPQVQPSVSTSTEVTQEQAVGIALAHAGLQSDEIKGLRAKRDRDDGITVYEIEFRHGRTEYEYDVRAADGEILDWDRDIDD